jgi:hypothetical protein
VDNTKPWKLNKGNPFVQSKIQKARLSDSLKIEHLDLTKDVGLIK